MQQIQYHVRPGDIFGCYEIIGRPNYRRNEWLCRCICGRERLIPAHEFFKRKTQKCIGCRTTHGMSGKNGYRSWTSMRNRCNNPKELAYPKYGGRGIEVCERWNKFENFWEDMGPSYKPGLQIERIDNDGNYEPGNCRWDTPKNQSNNKSNNTWIEAFGRTQTLAQWADEFAIGRSVISTRLKKGWSPENAVSAPKIGYPRPRGANKIVRA